MSTSTLNFLPLMHQGFYRRETKSVERYISMHTKQGVNDILQKFILETSDDLELHHFRTDEFLPEVYPFVEEILRTGIIIY